MLICCQRWKIHCNLSRPWRHHRRAYLNIRPNHMLVQLTNVARTAYVPGDDCQLPMNCVASTWVQSQRSWSLMIQPSDKVNCDCTITEYTIMASLVRILIPGVSYSHVNLANNHALYTINALYTNNLLWLINQPGEKNSGKCSYLFLF
jgi:hypothetical protein